MSNRDYIIGRLKDKDIVGAERKALEKALTNQALVYHGFQVGTEVWRGVFKVTVCSAEERMAKTGRATNTAVYVPVRYPNDTYSGISPKGLKKIYE